MGQLQTKQESGNKGDTGPTGPRGEKGPEGPAGSGGGGHSKDSLIWCADGVCRSTKDNHLEVSKDLTVNGALKVGNWTIKPNSGGHLEFVTPSGKVIFGQDGNIWDGKNGRWLSAALDKDSQYAIKSTKNGVLSDQGNAMFIDKTPEDWEKFRFVKI
jgi:hypothetical protein